MKTCFKCNETQPLSEFYRHPRMADGHLNKCKTCAKKDVATHYRKDIDSNRAKNRRRCSDMWKNKPDFRNHCRAYQHAWKSKHPAKKKAQTAVGNAVRDGRLQKAESCTRCGDSSRRIEAHHWDYSLPMEVEWLCSVCHKAADNERRESEPAKI